MNRIPGGGRPVGLVDFFNVARLRVPTDALIFSPGYFAGLSRARQLVTLHDTILMTNEATVARRAYFERFLRHAVHRTGMVLTVSETSRAKIRDWLQDEDVEVCNVGNGLTFAPKQRAPSGQPSRGIRLLYVGNARYHKRLEFAIEVALRVGPERFDLVVPEEVPVLTNLGRADFDVEVHCGIREDVLAQLYAESDVLLMPSIDEGFGMPAVEAVSLGARVVYWSGCTAITEAIGDLGTAVHDVNDAEAWARAVEAASATSLSFDAVHTQLARHDWAAVADRVLSCIEVLR